MGAGAHKKYLIWRGISGRKFKCVRSRCGNVITPLHGGLAMMETVLNISWRIKSDTPLSRFTTLSPVITTEKYRFSLGLHCGIPIAHKQARP